MAARRVVRVLVDSPLPQLDRLFDYTVPDEWAADAVPGVRVKVPLRSAGRVIEGFIVEPGVDDPADRPLSEIDSVVSPVPVLPERLYALARAVADRAAGSANDILRLAVPKRMVRAEKAWLAGETATGPAISDAVREAAATTLSEFPGLSELIDQAGRAAVDAPPRTVQLPDGDHVGAWAQLLAAAATLQLARGRSAVLVVPDHRDQDQLQRALAGAVPADAVVRVDARQSGPERYAGYLRILSAAPCVVVGSRSAVYAPAHDAGLVALWDDGDPLLSEPLSPGVHARDAALVRQELHGGALLVAGHTRTTDVQRLVEAGWIREVHAARRFSPRVVLSATREGEARGSRVPSAAFAAARDALATGPVLVQVARPGFAPTLVCAACRTPARCRECGGALRADRRGAVPECSWCGRSARGWRCAACDSDRVRMSSSGSERTADELGRAFPGTRVVIADGEHPVARVDTRPALVVATRGAEPLADGGYRAVLLLDGDRMLQAAQLRIGESCLRWWSNAAALAAPGAPVHLVGVAGSVARALATWTQSAYAHAELVERAPLRMPPTVRVAAVEGTAADVESALTAVREAVPDLPVEAVLGPVPVAEGERVRAIVRFGYAQGRAACAALRGAVVAAALRTRRRVKPGPARARNTLKVRVDVLEPEL